MPIDNTIYAYSVARVKALETRLLNQSQFERMINSTSAEEALKVLSESDYAAAITEMADIHEFEPVLTDELQYAYDVVMKIAPLPELIGMLALRYDVHNLKVLFKAKFLGIKSELLIPIGSLDLGKLENIVEEGDFRDLPEKLRRAADKITEDFLVNRNPQVIDLTLDQVLYDQLINDAREYRNCFLENLFIRQIDLTNLKTLIRVKHMGMGHEFLRSVLLPHGSISTDRFATMIEEPLESIISMLAISDYAELVSEGVREWSEKGSASLLEKLSDNYITAYLQQGKWEPFGVEPLVGYLWAKEIEVKNIRIVLVGKINKLPSDSIRERIRNVYV
ncbi:MAG: V-type ATP synthase subunit C [Bacillota bacterium]